MPDPRPTADLAEWLENVPKLNAPDATGQWHQWITVDEVAARLAAARPADQPERDHERREADNRCALCYEAWPCSGYTATHLAIKEDAARPAVGEDELRAVFIQHEAMGCCDSKTLDHVWQSIAASRPAVRDGLDVERLADAEAVIRARLRKTDPDSCLWMDGIQEHARALAVEYAALADKGSREAGEA